MGPQMSQPDVSKTDSKAWEFYKDMSTKKLSHFPGQMATLRTFFHVLLPSLQKNDHSYHSHFGDEATNAQRSEFTCPRLHSLHSESRAELGFEP